MADVNRALRDLRRAKKLTQAQLGDLAGTDQTAISDIERGRIRKPSWDLVAKIAAALDVEPRELFPVDDTAAVGGSTKSRATNSESTR